MCRKFLLSNDAHEHDCHCQRIIARGSNELISLALFNQFPKVNTTTSVYDNHHTSARNHGHGRPWSCGKRRSLQWYDGATAMGEMLVGGLWTAVAPYWRRCCLPCEPDNDRLAAEMVCNGGKFVKSWQPRVGPTATVCCCHNTAFVGCKWSWQQDCRTWVVIFFLLIECHRIYFIPH